MSPDTTVPEEACSFCPDGMPDPDFVLPVDGGVTCQASKELASSVSASLPRCATIQLAEEYCCGQGSVSPTEASIPGTDSPTKTPPAPTNTPTEAPIPNGEPCVYCPNRVADLNQPLSIDDDDNFC